MQKFDPYHLWLGIPPDEQPPTLYRLLGLSDFEPDQEVITEASYRQIGNVKQYASGPHRDAANKVLNELAKAQVILLNPRKKTQYDISIQEVTEEEHEAASEIARSNTTPEFQSEDTATLIKQSQHTRGTLGLFAVLTLVSVSLVSLCFWWLQDSDVPPSETMAANPDATAPTDSNESKVEQAEQPETNEALVEPPQPKETEPVDSNVAEVQPVDLKQAVETKSKASIKKQSANYLLSGPVTSVAFSPDGNQVVATGDNGAVKLWDTAQAESRDFDGHRGQVTSVAFSPDGQQIASGARDKNLILWNTETGQKLRTITGHTSVVQTVAFAPNGQQIASGGRDGVRLWDAASGQQLQRFARVTETVRSIAFSPDSSKLVGNYGKYLKLWDAVSGEELRAFTGHSNRICCVAFSPDGRASSSAEALINKLILWDVNSGQQLRSFSGHSRFISNVAFSPDGKEIISGSIDRTIKIWDVDSGKELNSYQMGPSPSSCTAFSSDAKRVAFGSSDKSIRVTDIGDVKPSGKAKPDALIRKHPIPQGHSNRCNNRCFLSRWQTDCEW